MTLLRSSALASSLLAASLTGCAHTPQGAPPAAPEVRVFTSDDSGFHTNSAWIDTGHEVVVFDTQFTPALAQSLLDTIQAATDSPVRWAVITHPNPDKFNGASVFAEAGATIVASEATAAAMPGVHDYKKAYFVGAGMFTEDTYPPLPTVDLVFEQTLDLPVDGAAVQLVELANPGVTTNQTVARVGDSVVVGDLVAAETHAWLEGGIVEGAAVPDVDGWRAALDELLTLVGPETTVVPGRGPTLPAGEVLPAASAYLARAQGVTTSYIDGLVDPAAALSEDGNTHYAALAELLAAEYPSYAHSYLVQYGIYGLAWQAAANGR